MTKTKTCKSSDNRISRITKIKCEGIACKLEAHTYTCSGMFCQKHSRELSNIRQKIKKASKEYDIYSELQWRKEEQRIRGSDLGHTYRILFLQNKLDYKTQVSFDDFRRYTNYNTHYNNLPIACI